MKELAQTLLIGGGIIGLLSSVPISAYGWFMHNGFGGALTNQERLMLYAPILCMVAIGIGFGWSKLSSKQEAHPRRPRTTRGQCP